MSKLKDFISILRDGTLLLLFFLLIFFPSFLNSTLERAGFTQGDVMGFTWKDKALQSADVAQTSQQLAESAGKQLEEMQNRLDSISQKLASIPETSQSPQVHEIAKTISASNEHLKQYNFALKSNVQTQNKKLSNIFNNQLYQVKKSPTE